MPKRFLDLLVPDKIKLHIQRKKAKKMLCDLLSLIHESTDDSCLMRIEFEGSLAMLRREYQIRHDLKKIDQKKFYPFVKTDVHDFLVILRNRLEDCLTKKNPSLGIKSLLTKVEKTLKKIHFIMMSEEEALPEYSFLFTQWNTANPRYEL